MTPLRVAWICLSATLSFLFFFLAGVAHPEPVWIFLVVLGFLWTTGSHAANLLTPRKDYD